MASFDYRLNPLYTIKECSSCGALYTTDYCCSNVGLVDKIIRDPNPISYDETPDSPSQPQTSSLNQHHFFHCKDPLKEHEHCKRCTCMWCGSRLSKGFCFICASSNKNSSQRLPNYPKCGDPVEGIYCRQRTLNQKKLEEVFQDFRDTFESSNDNTNVHPIFNAQDELLNSQNKLLEQITSVCDMVGQYIQKKEEEKRIEKEQAAKARYWKISVSYDDDDDEESSIPLKDIINSGLSPCVAITPVLSTKEPVDSLIMEDEHLDTISATESDKVIKVSVRELFSPGSKVSPRVFRQYFFYSISDDVSPTVRFIDYVDTSPPDAKSVSLEVVEIVVPEVRGIDTDILLTIKDDILHEKIIDCLYSQLLRLSI
ncbi:hypothetical protein Tco_0385044 [Tanacetum coccineum]